MKCVRLPLLSRDFLLGHVDAESLVRHHPDCKDLLIEALKFHLLPEQRGVLGTSRTRPRRCEGAGPVLFAVGTLAGPLWYPNPCPMSSTHGPTQAHPTLCQVHPILTPHLLFHPSRCDLLANPCPHLPLESPRPHPCAVLEPPGPSSRLITSLSLGGGSLFAIHGDCEAYDTRTDRWHVVASMSTRRARVGVAAVGNRLYAVGG